MIVFRCGQTCEAYVDLAIDTELENAAGNIFGIRILSNFPAIITC